MCYYLNVQFQSQKVKKLHQTLLGEFDVSVYRSVLTA